jgi:hypothetical protein
MQAIARSDLTTARASMQQRLAADCELLQHA